jgi:hypothetical protein
MFAAFFAWSVLRGLLAIFRTRRGLSWAGPQRVVRTEYFCGLLWRLALASFWLFAFFSTIGELITGRMGRGVHHGPMERSENPILFYLIEVFLLLLSTGAFSEAMYSFFKQVRQEKQRLPEARS